MSDITKVILEHLLPLAIAIITPVLLLLARRLVLYLEKKLNFDVSVEHETRLECLLASAIAYAEEWARKKVKLGENPPESAQKLDVALDYLTDELKRTGTNELQRDKLIRLIEAHLGAHRRS